jgi:hypothetical protein
MRLAESFTKRVIYDVPVYMSRHPQLCEYIHAMLVGCRHWIRAGELEKLQVVLLAENGVIMRRLSIENSWTATLTQVSSDSVTNGSDTSWEKGDEPLPLSAISEEFRAALVALTATPITYGYDHQPSACSFRLLAHTSEDSSRSGTALNEDTPANSWVNADPYWYTDQFDEELKTEEKTNELLPITSIQGEQLPLRMQMYLEDR